LPENVFRRFGVTSGHGAKKVEVRDCINGVEAHIVLGFALACVILNAVPGPGMMFMIAHGIAGGRRAGLVATAGSAVGTAVHTVAAALGLSALVNAGPHRHPISHCLNRVAYPHFGHG
jgi:LysE type translocator